MQDIKWFYWLAGLIEGEGSFIRTKNCLFFKLAMTDWDIVADAKGVVGLGSITGPYQYKHEQPLWHWTISKEQDVAALMMMVYPLMGERRREKIKELLLYWRNKPHTNRGKWDRTDRKRLN